MKTHIVCLGGGYFPCVTRDRHLCGFLGGGQARIEDAARICRLYANAHLECIYSTEVIYPQDPVLGVARVDGGFSVIQLRTDQMDFDHRIYRCSEEAFSLAHQMAASYRLPLMTGSVFHLR